MTSHIRVIRVGPVVRRGPIGDAVIAAIGMVNSDVELLDRGVAVAPAFALDLTAVADIAAMHEHLVAGMAGPAELAQ